jgi:hypothetical protein
MASAFCSVGSLGSLRTVQRTVPNITSVEQQNEALACVTYKISIQKYNADKLQLDRTYANTYTSYFALSSEVVSITDDGENPQNYTIEVRLRELTGPDDGLGSSGKEDTVPDYCRRPCDVWMTLINERNKLFFRQSSSNEWKSPKIILPLLQPSATIGTCLISIKFNSFRQGEAKVVKSLLGLLLHQTQCDVKFCFEDGRHVGGHIPILANRSPVFAAMFSHDMQEKKTGQVVIKDIQPEIFKEMLHYLYAGRTRISIVKCTAQPLFLAAEKYDIKELKDECIQFLILHIQSGNVIELIVWADLYRVEEIKEAAFQFVGENYKTIFPTTEWENLMKLYPDLCLLVTRRMIQ